MKILNLKQLKSTEYEIIVEKSESFLLFDETILRYSILVGKEVTEDDLRNFKEYNDVMKEYYNILKSIKTKMKSKKEIVDVLSKNKVSDDNIKIILDKLIKINLIDDNKYTDKYISYKINTTHDGPKKIYNALLNKGIESNIINKYLNNIDENVWVEKIKKIINKKSNSNRKYSNTELISKIKVYLINLGYNSNIFNEYLILEDNKDSLYIEKEYLKQLKKYSRKNLSIVEMNYKIKNSLLVKGFNLEDINNVIAKKNEE